jgi:hypothetical protein
MKMNTLQIMFCFYGATINLMLNTSFKKQMMQEFILIKKAANAAFFWHLECCLPPRINQQTY